MRPNGQREVSTRSYNNSGHQKRTQNVTERNMKGLAKLLMVRKHLRGGAGRGRSHWKEARLILPHCSRVRNSRWVGAQLQLCSLHRPTRQERRLGAGGTGSLKELYFWPSLAVPQPQTFCNLPKQHCRPGTECSDTCTLRAFHTQPSAGA